MNKDAISTQKDSKQAFRPFGVYNDNRDMNLVNMILNIESNNSNDYKKPLDVYEIYMQMKELNFQEHFKQSLKNSRDCVKIPPLTNMKLSELQVNDPNSFLVLPLLGKGHLWSTLIRRTEEGLSAYVVNKGLRYWHDPLEEFVFKNENQRNLVEVLKFAGAFKINNIEDVYRQFIQTSDAQYNLAVNMSKQKVGNCFTKNIQAGIKLAYASRDMSRKEMKELRLPSPYTSYGTNPPKKKTFKWDIMSTETMQDLVVKRINDSNKALSNKVEQSLHIYHANKHFRQNIKEEKPSTESFFLGFDPQGTTQHLPQDARTKSLLKDLTPYTLDANRNDIAMVVKNSNNKSLQQVHHEMLRYVQLGKENMSNLYFHFFMEARHDTLRSLETIYDRAGTLSNLPLQEKAKQLLEKPNPVMLWLHKSKIKEVIAFAYGTENVEQEYARIFNKATVAMEMNRRSEPTPEVMQKISEQYPIVVGQVNHRISEYYQNIAEYLLNKLNKPKEALQYSERACQFQSSYDNAMLKGDCLSSLGEHKQAISQFTKAIGMDPSNATGYVRRGKAYEKMNNKLASRQDYETAQKLEPEIKAMVQESSKKLSLSIC